MTSKKIKEYWTNKINNSVSNYKSLEFLTEEINIGKVHPMLTTSANARDICRLPSRIKMTTGSIFYSRKELHSTATKWIPHVDPVIKGKKL